MGMAMPMDASPKPNANATTAAPARARAIARARATSWKSSSRVTSFIAHVLSGLFLVGVVSSYLWRQAVAALVYVPSPQAVLALLLDQIARLPTRVHPCWDSADVAASIAQCWQQAATHHFAWADLADPEVRSRGGVLLAIVLLVVFALLKYRWIGWYMWLQLVVFLQWCVALYQVARIALSSALYLSVKIVKNVVYAAKRALIFMFGIRSKHAEALRQLMKQAATFDEYAHMAEYLDQLENKEDWKATISTDDMEHCDFLQLSENLRRLSEAIETNNVDALQFLLTSLLMRNKLGMDAAELHLACNTGTKHVIKRYNAMLLQAIDLLAHAPEQSFPVDRKRAFFRMLKQSFGSTALCLSGGGSIAMYHMGVIKALLEADLMPNVVSGSSGGSITAAFTACNTNQELVDHILKTDLAVRYLPLGIRWFPPLLEQLEHCIKTGFLVECSDFERTTQHYFADPMDSEDKILHYTFQDAFLKTGRHVSITVSASDITGNKGPKKLLLNHVSTPHVLLWSAVAVSCSLPGIMKGKKLMARDHEGNIVPYDATDNEWVDGSIQHDLPMETMASCFNVTNFIVSQVNPHVVPFVGDDVHTPHFRKSLFHTLESVIAADVRHRLKMLAFLGLFPKIYGHQFSSYFKQNFSGNVTLIPEFIFLEAIGVKAIVNPPRDDMERYILGGQRAVWPKLAYIRHLCEIEKGLDRCLSRLVDRNVVRYENWLGPTRDGNE